MRFQSPLHLRSCVNLILIAAFFSLSWPANVGAQDKTPAASSLDEQQILRHLNSVITWYHKMKTQVQAVGLPTDALYQANATRLAGEVVSFAFESAEKAAPFLPSENVQASTATLRQKLAKRIQDIAAHNAQLQTQIDQLNSKIPSAPRRNKQALIDQRDRLTGELDLGNSMFNSLSQLTKISEQKNAKAGKNSANQPDPNGFAASVAQLKSTLPEIFDNKNQPAAAPVQAQNLGSPSGLIGQLRRLYDQSMSLRQIDTLTLETNQLLEFVNSIRLPLRDQMIATSVQGDALSAAADNPQPGHPMPTKQDFDTLAARFDQLAAVEVPLSHEATALNETKANLVDWRSSIAREYGSILRSVFIRVAVILGVLGFLFLVSELWKRMAFRYIADTRRRRQFLVIRRFVIGFLMGLVFILGFVSEFSALATFAGFITAGLAVGLQTILLSVAAYFFLIGRYGLRVGDRISISGVTGDVVDVGIIRFYLLELAGTGIDLQPTGRVVAFANSVLFQATTPMFRQVPGTDYTWHEIVVTLQPAGNHKLVEDTMIQLVQRIFEKYQPALDRQQRSIEQRFEMPFIPMKPRAQMQLTSTGLEAIVRYPVSLQHNVDADDEITRQLIELIAGNKELQAAVEGLPKIRAAIPS